MSIASRIESMYDNVDKAYKSINKLGVDLTDVDKNIENISPLLDDFYDTLPKVTGTGETLTLNNTSEAPMKIDLKGNTSQASEPTPDSPVDVNVVSGDNTIEICGKNLFGFGISAIDKTSTYRTNASQRLVLTSTSDVNEVKFNYNNGKYSRGYFEINGIDGTLNYEISFNLKESTTSYTPIVAVDTENSTNKKLVFYVGGGNGGTDASSSDYFILNNIQLEKGTTATTYEPYTSQTQLISLGVENLFDKDHANIYNGYISSGDNHELNSSNNSSTMYIACKPNTTYTLSKISSSYFRVGYTYNLPVTNEIVYGYNSTGVTSTTITTDSSAKYLVVTYWANSDTLTEQQILDTIQIEVGSKANSYSEYGTTPIELCKIGDYQDYIYKTDKWYLHEEIGKVVLDGSSDESWGSWDGQSLTNTILFGTSIIDNIGKEANIGLSTYFENKTTSLWNNDIVGMTISSSGSRQVRVRINKTIANNYASFITWIENHNVIVYYVLATPTNTEITDSTLIDQLDNLQNLNSYNPTTNIMQENNDKPFILDVTALKVFE